jgi:hypothetical protein
MVGLRLFAVVLGILLILLGLIFMAVSADTDLLHRLIVAVPMLVLGVFLVRKGIRECSDKTVVISRTVELSEDVDLENMTCKKCGARLSSNNIVLKDGTVFQSCPCCKTEYQIEGNSWQRKLSV